MPGPPLDLDEREEIRAGLVSGDTYASIAIRIARDQSTVSREVARNGGRDHYRAVVAHRRARRCRARPKIAKLLADPNLAKVVNRDLHLGYSPAGIAARLRHAGGPTVCTETIYQALYADDYRGLTLMGHHCLRTRRRRRRKRGRRQRLLTRRYAMGEVRLIDERPIAMDDRSEPGHWEGDLIAGSKNQSAIATLVERVSRFTMLVALPDGRHGADQFLETLSVALDAVPAPLRRSLAWDQGHEMARWSEFERRLEWPIYFCHPRSPWQRPLNEQNNGILRYWFPKNADLSVFSQSKLDRVTSVLNSQPRRSINWATPAERYRSLTVL